jgi:hypothetical protein
MAYRLLIVALERSGEIRKMIEVAAAFREKFPRFRLSEWSARAFYNQEQREIMVAGLRRAGLPE